MSRKYSIGFLIAMLFIVCLFVIGYDYSYRRALEYNNNSNGNQILQTTYLIKEKDGYVTVYLKDGSVYEYTSILSSELPKAIQDGMKSGIELESITDVYGFLENYSS